MLGTESETQIHSKNIPSQKTSLPISIPKNPSLQNLFNDDDNNLYQNVLSLSGNFFNPQKFSPPDVWKNRLQDRIKQYLGPSIITVKTEK